MENIETEATTDSNENKNTSNDLDTIKIDEVKNDNNNDKNINNDNDNILKENEKTTKNESVDPNFVFRKELLNIMNTQEKILISTSTINEKFSVSNEITKEQIASFKTSIDKYGNYLLQIKKELGMISETMRKIKKLAKENKK